MLAIPVDETFAFIDDEDYELVSSYTWHLHSMGYAYSGKDILMHRVIMGAIKGQEIDHKDRNPLNNTRENLRFCSSTQNKQNRPKYKTNTSGYKGVSWHTPTKKWRARITINKKHVLIGLFKNKIDAAKAYDMLASEQFGEFAYLNFGENK